MTMRWPILAALFVTFSPATPIAQTDFDRAIQDPLVRVRGLYGAAEYEEALASLPAMPQPGQEDDVDRYRMLCLLALGRMGEAEQAAERALVRNPGFAVLPREVSPRVVDFVREVRQRVLPMRAESLYARARADFDERRYVEAASRFTLVLDLLSEPDVASIGKLADLRIVAEEFQRLSYERLPEGTRSSLVGATDAVEMVELDRLYTRLSPNVKPPLELSRPMPVWSPPRGEEWRRVRGVIEVTVDKQGRVEDAQMLERLAPFYDPVLVAAARKWTFRPATLFGHPVRYRHLIEVRVGPTN
jgi:tetratricopeptide (TPR) repeat protein